MSSFLQRSRLRQVITQRPLLALLVVAAVLRIGVVWWKFENLSTDTDSYLVIAKNLLAGEGFCSVPGRPTAFRPPLYPFFVAACTFCCGTVGLAVMQIALGTATCGVAWVFASRLQLSERARLLTTFAVAVDPLLLLYTSHAMTETLVTFLVTLLLVVTASKRSTSNSVAMGFLFGLAVLCRPSLWAFGGLACGLWLIRLLRQPSSQAARLETARWCIPVVIAVLVTVAPWGIRNAFVFGQPIFMTTHGGYTLLLANNPVFYEQVVADGEVWSVASLEDWQNHVDEILAERGVTTTDELERDAAMKEMAMRHIWQQPGWFARSCLTGVTRFWSPMPQASAASRPVRLAVGAWYMCVFVLLFVGIVRIRTFGHDVLPALLLIVSLTFVHTVFWSNARMRAPVTVGVALIGASVVFPRKTKCQRTVESA